MLDEIAWDNKNHSFEMAEAICPSSYGQIAESYLPVKGSYLALVQLIWDLVGPRPTWIWKTVTRRAWVVNFGDLAGGRLPDERVKNFLVLGKKFTEKVMGPENLPEKGGAGRTGEREERFPTKHLTPLYPDSKVTRSTFWCATFSIRYRIDLKYVQIDVYFV